MDLNYNATLKSKKKKTKKNKLDLESNVSRSQMEFDVSKKKRCKSSLEDSRNSDEDLSTLSILHTPNKKRKTEEIEHKDIKESLKLLSLAAAQVHQEMVPYTRRWTSLDFHSIAKQFEGKSPEDCEFLLKLLIENISKQKCLHQLLTETMKELPKSKTPRTSFTNFIHLNSEQIGEEVNKGNLGNTTLSVAAAMWKAMTKEEKKSFEPDKRKKSKFDGESSFDVYYAHLKRKQPTISNKDARIKWTELSLSKKLKYIKKSAKIMKQFLDVQDENSEDNKKVKGPTIEEAALHLESVNFPKEPFRIPATHYYSKECQGSEQQPKNMLMSAIKAFNKLSKDKQEEWIKKHKKAVKKYENSLEEWKNQQDEITSFIYKVFKEDKSEKKKEKKGKAKEQMSSKSKSNLKYVEMPIGNIKFKTEPGMPPLTPVMLFSEQLAMKTGEQLTPSKVKERFAILDNIAKSTLKSKCLVLKEQYIKELKKFVDDLVDDQRRLYLGLKRVRLIRLLGEDIFKDQYPDSIYPVYKKPGKNASDKISEDAVPSENKETSEAELDEEVTDETEEEEEDLEDFASPLPRKQMRDFSPRKTSNNRTSPPQSKNKHFEKKISRNSSELDDFESEDETSHIY